jgi:hypothetical protein
MPWNDGILKTRVLPNEIFSYKDGTDQNLKSDHHPFLIPNNPIIQYSTIPIVSEANFELPGCLS